MLAERGDAGAQANLSSRYLSGEGVEQSGAESARWYRAAAEQNVSRSYKYILGRKYFWGEGIPQDHAEAVRWFEKAAALEGGFPPNGAAERELALMHRMGFGVAQDHNQAEYWLCRSISYGSSKQACIAAPAGPGSNQRLYDRRISWARSAFQQLAADAQEGNPAALYFFVRYYFQFGYIWGYDTLPNHILPESLQGRIVVPGTAWSGEQPDVRLLALAEEGNPAAQYYVGEMHHYGYGVPQSHAEAVRWYRAAAEQGYWAANLGLSNAYIYGWGVPQDAAESTRWLRVLADQGNSSGQYWLALRYRRGQGVPHDAGEYVRLMLLSAEQGGGSAYRLLGDAYLRGYGVAQDDAAAAEWHRRYAARSSRFINTSDQKLAWMHYYGKIPPDAAAASIEKLVNSSSSNSTHQYQRGLMHYHGKGVAQDSAAAVLQLREAATTGTFELPRLVLTALSEKGEAPPALIPRGRSSEDASVLLADLHSKSSGAPNAMATAFGAGFAGLGARAAGVLDETGRLSTQVGGVCLEVDGVKAPLLFVSDRQINFQVPAETAVNADANVEIVAGCGTDQERRSAPASFRIAERTPAFFLFGDLGTIAALHGADYTPVGDGNYIPGAAPAKPGEVVVLYGTGFGAVSPALASGEPAAGARRLTGNVSAELGRAGLPSEIPEGAEWRSIYHGNIYWEPNTTLYADEVGDVDVLYAGAAPGFAGLYQANVRIPENTPAGVLSLRVSIGDSVASGFILVAEE